MEISSHLNFVLLLISLCLPRTAAFEGQLPGCPSKCGYLTVPYPFGISVNASCSINPFFNINCDASFDPPKAFLGSDKLEVLGIYDTKILIRSQLAWACYDNGVNATSNVDFSMDLPGTLFSFSGENKLTVVGCDDFSFMTSNDGLMISCKSVCSKAQDLRNDSCFGIGCCQSSIPMGLQSIYATVISMSGHSRVQNFNPCGYSFLAEENSYEFKTSDISDSSFINRRIETVPVVVDWAIDDRTCNQIRNKNHVCQGESVCVDSGGNLGGYRCNCSKGYQGNPYLSPGCQDINECKSFPCHPKAICINLPGSFNCSCPPNYLGDGTNLGTGCIFLKTPTKTTLYSGLLVGLGLFLLLIGSFLLYKILKKRRAKKLKHHRFKRNGGLLLLQQQIADDTVLEETTIFTSKELEKATDRYNESRILGQGGQGTVYKGMLSDGRIVAVKKSKQVDEHQRAEFINEVVILSKINHRNVVRLLGCCLETEVPLLVYEFIPNGTLYDLIHDDTTDFPFTWDLRLRIAAEIANALTYLHYATSVPIYHRDMKSNNILLDKKYRAKLSDFGISRSVAIDQTHLTTKVKGTFGYLDPEYFRTSMFTEKSDVYSFGVVLVELLTGQKPISTSAVEEERSLVMHFLLTMEENRLKTILDPQLTEQGVDEELIVVANLAKRCLSLSGKKRPTTREVATVLESIRTYENPSAVEDNICTETESFELQDDDSSLTNNVSCGVE